MLDELKYVNCKGAEVVFGDGIFLNENDLRDIGWNFERATYRDRLTRSTQTKTLPVRICVDDERGIEVRNGFVDAIDIDCSLQQPGRFVVNGYELRCYVTEMRFSRYLDRNGYVRIDLAVEPIDGAWSKPIRHVFSEVIDSGESDALDFPLGFPFDFGAVRPNSVDMGTALTPSPFLMRIFGPVSRPRVTVGGNVYGVDAEVADGARLEIDSRAKTIEIIERDGTRTDCFRDRVRGAQGSGSYIFEPIPAKAAQVVWNGLFDFELIAYEERSTPKC